jgi:hypothetical protein
MKNYTNSTGWLEIYSDLQSVAKILFEIENTIIGTNIFNIFKKKNYDDCEIRLKNCLVELQKYDVIEGPANANIDKLNSLCELAIAMATYNISLIAICMNLSLKSKGGEYTRALYLKDLREVDAGREILALKQETALL